MEADFLKLAYIAEFAIVFNLAFGEFKTNAIDLIVNESINKLRKISETILTVGASASSPSKTHDTTINRFGKFTAAVNGMHGIAPLDTNSAVIKNFRNRFRVFCTDTKKLEEKISTFRVFFQYLKSLVSDKLHPHIRISFLADLGM